MILIPQLVKGGKYIFGWSNIGKHGEITIPDEAFEEYGFKNDDKLIIMSGSKRSGGFGLTSLRLVENTVIGHKINSIEHLRNYKIPEGNVIQNGERLFSWLKLQKSRLITLHQNLLDTFSLLTSTKLLVGRGSGLALAFIAKGPIFMEAQKHSELLVF